MRMKVLREMIYFSKYSSFEREILQQNGEVRVSLVAKMKQDGGDFFLNHRKFVAVSCTRQKSPVRFRKIKHVLVVLLSLPIVCIIPTGTHYITRVKCYKFSFLRWFSAVSSLYDTYREENCRSVRYAG